MSEQGQVTRKTVSLKTGPDRVAALLLTVGNPTAGRILKHFSVDEIKLITRSAAGLGMIPPEQQEILIEEFFEQFQAGSHLFGTAQEVEKLLTGVLPSEQVADIMANVLGNSFQSIWDRISGIPEGILANYLQNEHPQTVAIIMSRVKPACAAKVMVHLPPELRNDVTRRMLACKPVVEEVIQVLESTLHEDLMTNFSQNKGADTHAKMADIINKMDRDHMEELLQNLADEKPKSAEILKGLLFTFEDIVKITPAARSALFDAVPAETMIIALRGTNASYREIVLSALPARSRRTVESELASAQPIPQREVLEARRSITDLALDMAGRGEIELHSEAEQDMFMQ
ncbi:flagellar motor switch protein FliG [Pseudochelatococcus contaminans]|uniref:Flagellar motor switch protein FliG n=1 Tax=Pseudochelatococcus contaminans TaxID=1538103 RepID=A0A7W5Z169_9HYPH|nr:flagellar motor switch protein FliG [Pseudochelatococcus contaminans]MBB3808020.1 flagellar motor switch protein FliG [Pseudochelatococcus contaminans]